MSNKSKGINRSTYFVLHFCYNSYNYDMMINLHPKDESSKVDVMQRMSTVVRYCFSLSVFYHFLFMYVIETVSLELNISII